MTLLAGHSHGTQSWEWPFETTRETLELAGGHYAPEQIRLYERAIGMVDVPFGEDLWALAVTTVADPRWGSRDLALTTLDTHEFTAPVVVPVAVLIDWDLWPALDEYDTGWRRFPSLPGRVYSQMPTGDYEIGGVDAFRLWDLWPLSGRTAVDRVHYAALQYWETVLKPLFDWYDAAEDPEAACRYAGTPPATHLHWHDGLRLVECHDGVAHLNDYADKHLTLDVDGFVHPLPLPPVSSLGPLEPLWDAACVYGRLNTHAGLASYPDSERESVRDAERRYSPWSWLSSSRQARRSP